MPRQTRIEVYGVLILVHRFRLFVTGFLTLIPDLALPVSPHIFSSSPDHIFSTPTVSVPLVSRDPGTWLEVPYSPLPVEHVNPVSSLVTFCSVGVTGCHVDSRVCVPIRTTEVSGRSGVGTCHAHILVYRNRLQVCGLFLPCTLVLVPRSVMSTVGIHPLLPQSLLTPYRLTHRLPVHR